MTGKAAPVAAKDWFNSQRGWSLEPMMFVQKAGSFSEALRLGAQETVDATLLVYRTLHSSWEPSRFPSATFPVPGASSRWP